MPKGVITFNDCAGGASFLWVPVGPDAMNWGGLLGGGLLANATLEEDIPKGKGGVIWPRTGASGATKDFSATPTVHEMEGGILWANYTDPDSLAEISTTNGCVWVTKAFFIENGGDDAKWRIAKWSYTAPVLGDEDVHYLINVEEGVSVGGVTEFWPVTNPSQYFGKGIRWLVP